MIMDWTPFFVGLFFGVIVGGFLLALIQCIRERNDEWGDMMAEEEASGSVDDEDARYLRRLREENRIWVERVTGKEELR